MLKRILLLHFLLLFGFGVAAQTDTYQGYRLHLVDIERVKSSKSNTKFRCALTNTGRETVALGKYRTSKDTIPLIEFDTTLEKYNLQGQVDQIRYSVLSQENYVIKAGETVKDVSVQINNANTILLKPTLKDTVIKPDTVSVRMAVANPKPDTIIRVVATSTALPTPRISVDTVLRPVGIAKQTMVKDTLVPTIGIVDSAKTLCPDLVIDGVRVAKLTEKYIWVEFNVFNKGTGAATIYGNGLKKEQYLAVHFYFSGTPRLSRGSVFADGIFITEGLKETKGILAANTGVKQTIKISLEKLTRFNKVLLLQIDGFNTTEECDETNNGNYIIPNW
jgi:hypothetical protein